MDSPVLYKPHPSLFPLSVLGGLTGTVLLTSSLRLAAARGLSVVDLPPLLGGLFSDNPGTGFNAGHAVFIVTGVFVLPLVMALLWPLTPGDRFTFRGALIKGALWGLVLFVFTGVLLPVLGVLARAPGDVAAAPGVFGIGLGLWGPTQLLLGTQLYALTSAVVAAMARGLQPLDSIGWGWWSHGSGESP